MRRCVIIGGADIEYYDKISRMLKEDDFVIYCDCGLRHMDRLNKKPDLVIGDFDSHENPGYTHIETIVLPCEKDDTDTVFAAKEALKRGFNDFLLAGFVGNRLDHTLANVSLLYMLYREKASAVLVDDYSEMVIAGADPEYIDDSFGFFSLLNVFGPAEGIHISGARYPLDNGVITPDYQYGVSNEVLPGETACVKVEKGNLLLIKVFK